MSGTTMADSPMSPQLGGSDDGHGRPNRPRSQRSKRSSHTRQLEASVHSDESTPLLSRGDEEHGNGYTQANGEGSLEAPASPRSLHDSEQHEGKGRRRWPTIVALSTLGLAVVAILGLGFAAPTIVEEYAKQAAIFEPTDLSIDSFTASGVKARIKGDFMLDATRVQKKSVRDLGRFGTWLARAVESKSAKVRVYLPEYGDVLLGTASVPPVVVDIRDRRTTSIDILVDLEPGDVDGVRRIANDWIDGRLGQLRIKGEAEVDLKSGIFGLGTQSLSETLLFKEHDIPEMPQYNISKLNFHEVDLPQSTKGMEADVSITVRNRYPLTFTIPPLGFDILVPGCTAGEPYILLANATTEEAPVVAKQDVNATVHGVIRRLDASLTAICPDRGTSPLDALLGNYIHGVDTTIFVRGADAPSSNTPDWISNLIKDVVLPLPFPGHTFDNLMRDFSLENVHLDLPSPIADPDSPAGRPKISATVKALVNLPKEMNFPIDVGRVRASADVFYHNKKLGILDLHKWQNANSTRIEPHDDEDAGLAVESIVRKAPLEITDDDVFSKVVQDLLFGGSSIVLGVTADVDIETETALGKFVIRNIPAEGKVPIKPIAGGHLENFAPKVGSLRIVSTTRDSLLIEAKVNMTNPTNYSATVPYVNVNLLSNGTLLGSATAENIKVVPGRNENMLVRAKWEPLSASGKKGVEAGKELLSQYISGYNTTLGIQTDNGSIPAQPRLGSALSSIELQVPTPKLVTPKNPNHPDDEDDGRDEKAPRFIDDATMHLFTSTASFTLLSPFPHTTVFITHINATAYYNHTEPIGVIIYELPFAVLPGATTSPRLPVDWSLDSVGRDAVKQALGGTLKLDAQATVGVKIGAWEQTVWFTGGGIGAHIRI